MDFLFSSFQSDPIILDSNPNPFGAGDVRLSVKRVASGEVKVHSDTICTSIFDEGEIE